MPSAYKLTYFDIRGRAEVIRFIFAQAGIKYEDVRITYDGWPALKPNTPYGVLPILEVDGKVLGGNGPISRFLAERFGLAGTSDIEKAELDGIMDCLDDFTTQVGRFTMEEDATQKVKYKRALEEEHIPRVFGVLEKKITANNSPSGPGWVYGSNVTYVDLRITTTVRMMKDLINEKVLDGYPAIERLTKAVESLPNIAKWIKERPNSSY